MINPVERIFAYNSYDIVRKAYINRTLLETGRIENGESWLIQHGFEVIDVPDGYLLSDDGREILRAHGKAWALRPEIHAMRLAEALDQARQRDAAIATQSTQLLTQPAICPVLIDSQLCGGELSRKPICPKHHLWIHGVREILTCDVCGAQTAVMR